MMIETERIPAQSLTKSVEDKRQYRRLRLRNGLRVVIVQREPELDQADTASCSSQDSGSEAGGDKKPAALALGVTVGHFYDPPEFPGLAHLLEHMLFLDRAPEENSWEQFLSEHGGWSNATTSEETTLYFYEIHPDYLSESIARFVSLFLLDPFLCPEAVDREVQAVESEFQEGLLVDEHRLTQIMCHISKPGHPFQKFGWGNCKSLCSQSSSTEIAAALRRFHNDYYRAENMNLVIMVSDNLDQVEADVIKHFGLVASGSVPKLAASGLPFNMDASEPRLIKVAPVKEIYSLELVFQLQSLQTQYAAQPWGYWGEVIGDEGPGSVAQILRERGLASELKAGLGHEQTYQNSLFFLFTIQVTLTKLGHSEWREVLRLLFAYIHTCVSAGPQRHLWDQYSSMAAASFTWAEPKEPAETVEELAYSMQRYSWDDIVSGPYLWQRYDPDLIMSFGNQLRPENVLVFMQASFGSTNSDSPDSVPTDQYKPTGSCFDPSGFDGHDAVLAKGASNDCDGRHVSSSFSKTPHSETIVPSCNGQLLEIEPWFGTKFHRASLSSSFISSLNSAHDPALSLPSRSSLIPKSLAIVDRNVPSSPLQPYVAFRNDRLRVWHLIERQHVSPRAHITLRFYTGLCYSSPLAAVTSRLLIMLLEDALGTYLYEGEVADLSINLRATRRCLEFQGEGFSDRLFEFVLQVLCHHSKSLYQMEIQPDRFLLIKERLQIAWRSAFFSPSDQASYERLRVLQTPKFSIESLRAALDDTTLDDVSSTLEAIRSSAFIEAFLHGNVSAVNVDQLAKGICDAWGSRPTAPSPQTQPAVRLLPPGAIATWARPSFNPLENNSVHVSYYQFGPDTLRDRVLLRFLQRISSENCFDSLRTRSQLGYSVSVQFVNTDSVLGLTIEVISASHSPIDCEAAIEAWITDELYPLIRSMTDDVFDNHIEGFIMDIETQDYNLGSKHDRLWDEIVTHNYVFDRMDEEISVIEGVERKDLLSMMDRLFKTDRRSKLSTHVLGSKSTASLDQISLNESIEPFLKLPQISPKIDLPY